MLYGIAIFPDKEIQDAANSWRVRHDPHYCNIPAHLTLRDAEEWDDSTRELAILHLQHVASAFKPFSIRFNRVSTFFPVSNTLYLALEEPQTVITLKQAICSGPLVQPLSNQVYTPHVTIGRDMPADELHDLYGNLRMSSIDYSTVVDRFHLLYKTDQGGWTALQSFQFKG
ncbi:2'-5' RNA ligase family protein [Paenibacillus sp. GSMTC-2017]|uniref:2'-5' RNA ligase family protein n=1 Tax=Paenibacillus sp. GSMTC-2017 TaxID=2794350 RepID=UPI0018D60BB8|nr:2'-5' RNA ligase family protein [Paenibacillus sp. GSMTC-2017]MBH5316865.1 2'-5' RNA ligase family protein [Paenibacillus sp. GSMTC-2017]